MAPCFEEQGRPLFHIVNKSHTFLHWSWEAYFINPRAHTCWKGEDFVGQMAKLGHSVSFGVRTTRLSQKLMAKYQILLHLLYTREPSAFDILEDDGAWPCKRSAHTPLQKVLGIDVSHQSLTLKINRKINSRVAKKCQKTKNTEILYWFWPLKTSFFLLIFLSSEINIFYWFQIPKKYDFSLLIVVNSGCSGIHTYHFFNMFVFWTCLHFYMLAWQVYILTCLRFYMFSTICPYIHTFVIICTYIHTFIHPCIHIIYTYTHTHIHIHTVLCGVYTYRYTHTIYIMYTSNVFV